MYQLSHILVEQKNLIEHIQEETLIDDQKNVLIDHQNDDDDENELDQNKKAINVIKEHLIGYTKSLDDKYFIHEGSMIELNGDDHRPICRSHLFLFNDVLIIAKIKHDKKLEFMSEYETRKIAFSNIRELTGVKNALKIYLPDGSPRIYQTINAIAKTEWIEKFDAALKFNPTNKITFTSSAKQLTKQRSSVESQSNISEATLSPSKSTKDFQNDIPEWIIYSSEEIQAEIAQRHFEDSLALIQVRKKVHKKVCEEKH
jgi:exocyst complex component 8